MSPEESPCAVLDVICAPDGPDLPFGTPWLIVFDTARLFCIATALAAGYYLLRAMTLAWMPAQRSRLFGFGIFLLQAITTEAEHLGDGASIRLALNLVGALSGLYGSFRFDRESPRRRARGRHHRRRFWSRRERTDGP